MKAPIEANLYSAAAIADGGSGGSVACAQKTFDLLNVATPAFDMAKAYSDAAIADGGSGGNLFCAEKSTFKLLTD